MSGDYELRLHMLAAGSQEDFAFGSGPVFSTDNRRLAFRIGVTEEAQEKLTEAKKPVHDKLGLHSLVTGKTERIDDVASFRFSDDGRWLVMRRYPLSGRKSSGVDTIVRDLRSGRDTNLGNVGSFAWNDDGTLLAMTIDAEGKAGNGVQVFDAATGVLRTLDSADQDYRALTWRKDAADLAVLRGRDRDEKAGEDETAEAAASKDGYPEAATKSLRESLEDPAGVEIWHARDIDILPRQKKTGAAASSPAGGCRATAWWQDPPDARGGAEAARAQQEEEEGQAGEVTRRRGFRLDTEPPMRTVGGSRPHSPCTPS